VTVINPTRLLDQASTAIREVSEAARLVTITPETRLVEDLSLDSLDMVAVVMRLQDNHGIEFDLDEAVNFRTVADIMREMGRLFASQQADAA
jgi:acyl carrier protein